MNNLDLALVESALRKVLPNGGRPLSLHEPEFRGNEWTYLKDCLDTGWVSSIGSYVDRFERDLAAVTGAGHAIAVVNGTAALHICLQLVGVTSGDEVLVPALTFVATANAVSYCGAIPHFADCEEKTLGIDPRKLEAHLSAIAVVGPQGCINRQTGRRIRAIVPMHTFGHPVDLDRLIEICARFELQLVEDASESLGSWYKGRHTGTYGKVAALSFNGNKIVTTGGGGAILTGDAALAREAKHLTTTARVPHQWSFLHDRLGFNYRMPNINAALGCAQLEQLPRFVEQKRVLARNYRDALREVGGLKFFWEAEFATSNFWLNTLILDEQNKGQRDGLLERLNNLGFGARPAWTAMHRLPFHAPCPRMDLGVVESLEQRIINIPSSAALGA
jgi:perosamine synthetase